MAFQRGLDESQEQQTSRMLRDTRSLSERFLNAMREANTAAMVIVAVAFLGFVISALAELFLIFGVWLFLYCFLQKNKLPFRMPQRIKVKDYNDILPGGKEPSMARGIYFLGNEKKKKEEIWFSNNDMRTHMLIFGSTGSGKTEFLISTAYNALCQASGFIYVDGKGDNALFSKIFSMVRSMGRDDDMLLINFMTGARDIIGPQEKRLSNTMNPFASGSSSMLSQLIVSLMPGAGGSGDGDMWKGRAIGFVEALMRVLVTMRDSGHILLDANTIRNYFLLPKLEAMVIDKVFLRDGQEGISLENLPKSLLEPINGYLFNLPGYNPEKKGRQVSQVLEQHGFITMQLTRIFTSLADTYSHILRTNLAEVDLADVVLNRRVLCVLLPALEKSPDELANLGKIIIATLKAMMAGGLGDSVEGELRDIVDSRPTNSDTPFLCVLDEYGYYAVEGFAVVPAQARSLGFSVVFAGQDLPAFQKASKEEAASIGANTNIKVCMKLEDPTETWDFFMKSAGESYVTQVESYQTNMGSVMGGYQDNKGARLEKRARIDLLDLKEQTEGDMHIFFKSKIVRARTFYAAPKAVKEMRLNQFLKIAEPEDTDVRDLILSFQSIEKLAKDGIDWESVTVEQSTEELLDLFYNERVAAETNFDKALSFFHNEEEEGEIPDDFFSDFFNEEEMSQDELNIFVPLRQTIHIKSLIDPSELESPFSNEILSRSATRDGFGAIEKLMGMGVSQASNVAVELTADLERATAYPPEVKPNSDGAAIAKAIHGVIDSIVIKQKESVEGEASS